MAGRAFWVITLGISLSSIALGAEPTPFEKSAEPFLAKYCVGCHSGGKPKGSFDLAAFTSENAVQSNRRDWNRVVEEVRGLTMPPEGKPAPNSAERDCFLEYAVALQERGRNPDPGKPVLRRLTRLEFNNTIRDLFALPFDVFTLSERLPVRKEAYFRPGRQPMPDRVMVPAYEFGVQRAVLLPGAALPGDNRAEHGYSNRGDVLNLSPLLLEKTLRLADEIVSNPRNIELSPVLRELLADPHLPAGHAILKRDAKDALRFAATAELQAEESTPFVASVAGQTREDFARTLRLANADGQGGVLDLEAQPWATLAPGQSAIRVSFGKNASRLLLVTPDELLRVAPLSEAVPTAGRGGLASTRPGGARLFGLHFAIPDLAGPTGLHAVGLVAVGVQDGKGEVRMTAHLDDGRMLESSREVGGKGSNVLFAFTAPDGRTITRLTVDGSRYSAAGVAFDELGFVVSPDTPTPPREVDSAAVNRIARERLAQFLPRAFRRPVSDDVLNRYQALFEAQRRDGRGFPDAMRAVVRAVLTSPRFFYLSERIDPEKGAIRELDDFELACRLSYFLWSSMPDRELFRAAAAGELRRPEGMTRQVRRMLRDPKIRELSDSFAVQWLKLNEIWSARPDPTNFPLYYAGAGERGTLATPMLIEGLLLFETVLVEDRPIVDLVDPGFGYLNNRLLKLYGLSAAADTLTAAATKEGLAIPRPGVRGTLSTGANDVWQRVPLPDRTRGGILALSGPLTLTSLPTRTSPVKRGSWVLETLFNRPPPPPTVAVPPLEGDASTEPSVKLSVRQKLERHRADPSCSACHARIDPPGFALEVFNPIGALRTHDGEAAVDARGKLPDGRTFDGPIKFKDAVLAKKSEFVRGFSEHLLSYALGRGLTEADSPAVRKIVTESERDKGRLSALVLAVVRSEPFTKVRNREPEPGYPQENPR